MEKSTELRFSRDRRARQYVFASLASLCLSVAVATLLPGTFSCSGETFTYSVLGCGIALSAFFAFRSRRSLSQAFVILSRIGVEVLPPSHSKEQMILVHWPEIRSAEATPDFSSITLSLTSNDKLDIHLAGLSLPRRQFLLDAIRQILAQR